MIGQYQLHPSRVRKHLIIIDWWSSFALPANAPTLAPLEILKAHRSHAEEIKVQGYQERLQKDQRARLARDRDNYAATRRRKDDTS